MSIAIVVVLALLIALMVVLLVASAAPCTGPIAGPGLMAGCNAHKKGESVDSPESDAPAIA